jgi:hypothetical protein
VRTRGGEDLGAMSIDDFARKLTDSVACRGRSHLEG